VPVAVRQLVVWAGHRGHQLLAEGVVALDLQDLVATAAPAADPNPRRAHGRAERQARHGAAWALARARQAP